MSKTLLRHTLIKHIFDIFVDFLIFIHFHYMCIVARDPMLKRGELGSYSPVLLRYMLMYLIKTIPFNGSVVIYNSIVTLCLSSVSKCLKHLHVADNLN
jgi:hypothetical protein